MQNVRLECDNGQMQERYVHYDAEEMHDMNAFTDTRAWKIISPYLRIWGRSAHVCN